MSKTKAMFATTAIMALLAMVIFFIWKFSNTNTAFLVILVVFAVYGFISLADDLCRWLRTPDTTSLISKGGRH